MSYLSYDIRELWFHNGTSTPLDAKRVVLALPFTSIGYQQSGRQYSGAFLERARRRRTLWKSILGVVFLARSRQWRLS
jgi:hypothetical protein